MKLIYRVSEDQDPDDAIGTECRNCPWDTHLLNVCWWGWPFLALGVVWFGGLLVMGINLL